MPEGADAMLFRSGPVHQLLRVVLRLPGAAVCRRLGGRADERGRVLHPRRAGLEVFGVILAGYASASKWSLFGAMREAAQVVSYEVPLGMCVVVPVMIAGTMDLVTIGQMQQAGSPTGSSSTTRSRSSPSGSTSPAPWPASTGRRSTWPRPKASWWPASTPNTPASAGASSSWPNTARCSPSAAWRRSCSSAAGTGRSRSPTGWAWPARRTRCLHYLGNLLGCVNFLVKGVCGVTFMMWVRWTLPRLRIDQVMTTCLKYCVPLAAVMFLGATLWTYAAARGAVFALYALRQHPRRPNAVGTTGREFSGPARSRDPRGGALETRRRHRTIFEPGEE